MVMLEKKENGNSDNYQNDEAKLKAAMYTNPNYIQVMTELLPWLDNRGLLDWK